MAFPTDIPPSTVPTYFIYRDGDHNDVSAPPVFYPPKDSDELFDALRAKYPHVKSHSDRMRDAIIEFLLQEREAESLSNVSPSVPSLHDSNVTASPWQHSWPSMSSTCQSSPETTSLPTPSYGNSPKPQDLRKPRQTSTAATSSISSPPAIDQMTSVFSLSTSEQPKQRVRRKMTEAEKVEYRQRRIVKACDKCSKRKRKCNHNKPEAEATSTSHNNSDKKVRKPRNCKKALDRAWPFVPSAAIEAGEDFETLKHHEPTSYDAAEDFADLSALLNEPIPDINFDEIMDFSQPQSTDPFNQYNNEPMFIDPSPSQWPWSDTQDWTLLDPTTEDDFETQTPSGNIVDDLSGLIYPHASQAFHELHIPFDRQAPSNHEHIPADYDLQLHNQRALSNRSGTQSAHIVSSTSGLQSSPEQQRHELWQKPSFDHNLPDEGLRTGQFLASPSQAQQGPTAGLHDQPFLVGKGGTNTFTQGRAGEASNSSLAQTVLRLVGTAKAMRAFTGLLSSCPSAAARSQAMPLDRVVKAVGSNLKAPQSQLTDSTGRLIMLRASNLGLDWRRMATSASLSSGELATTSAPVLAGSSQAAMAAREGRPTAASGASSGVQTSLQSMSKRRLGSGVGILATTSALVSGRSPFDEHIPALQRTSGFAPSSDLESGASPSTELLRLKRRIPKALHSILDRDASTTSTASSSTPALPLSVPNRGANGGAYLQLSTETHSTFSLSGPSISTNAFSNPSATLRPNIPTPSSAPITNVRALATTPADQHSSDALPASAPYTVRLRDTNRHRDHHGRPALSASLAATFATLAAVCFLSTIPACSSWLLLALLTPLSASAPCQRQEAPLRCSLKNSSWLSALLFHSKKLACQKEPQRDQQSRSGRVLEQGVTKSVRC